MLHRLKKNRKLYIISGGILLSLTVLLCLVVVFGGLLFPPQSDKQANHLPSDVNNLKPARPITDISAPTTAVDNPVRLRIPKLQIDAAVEQVGVKPDGELQTPQQAPYTDVGWYSRGPKPSALGSAVIDGHLNQPGGDPAIFSTLHELQPGDKISVITQSGRTLQFIVNKISYYKPKEAPLQSIFGDYSGHYLNLITCAGEWVPSQQQTTLRVVVYTSLVQN